MRRWMARSPYTAWVATAVGLLGLTRGLGVLRNRGQRTTGWGMLALAMPLAAAGLTMWTGSLLRRLRTR